MPLTNAIGHLLLQATEQLAASSDTAQLDAEVLLCHCLSKNRSFLRAWPEHQLNEPQLTAYIDLIARRRQGVPVAYLTGRREFWSRDFVVNPDVLIPRPDSELLTERCLMLIPMEQPCKIIDLGTGSGILAITLASERPLAKVIATDLSEPALSTARLNANRLGAANVSFFQSDWFENIADHDFDLVLSNPPYIPADDPHLRQGDVRFEPQSALISADQGLKDITLLAEQARHHLKPGGHLLLEHGYNQQDPVQDIFTRFGFRQIATHRDLSGNPRVTSGTWNPT